jgi:hypothetical protein
MACDNENDFPDIMLGEPKKWKHRKVREYSRARTFQSVGIQGVFDLLQAGDPARQLHDVIEGNEAPSLVFKGLDKAVAENMGKRFAVSGFEIIHHLEGPDYVSKGVAVFRQEWELAPGEA